MTIRINVNKTIIAKNRKDGKKRPMYRVEFPGGDIWYCQEVVTLGPARFVDGPPLKCGARAYLQTDFEVDMYGAVRYSEIER